MASISSRSCHYNGSSVLGKITFISHRLGISKGRVAKTFSFTNELIPEVTSNFFCSRLCLEASVKDRLALKKVGAHVRHPCKAFSGALIEGRYWGEGVISSHAGTLFSKFLTSC